MLLIIRKLVLSAATSSDKSTIYRAGRVAPGPFVVAGVSDNKRKAI